MSEFDWVAARSACTLDKEFARLSSAVQDDLERHDALNPGLAQCQRFKPCGEDKFYVERPGVHRIIFEKERGRIRIGRWAHAGEHTPLMALRVRLDDDGECILVDEDQKTWKPWQVRRKALEETFFGKEQETAQ